MVCKHTEFRAAVTVHRLQDREGGPITGYTSCTTINCMECGLPFRFVGLEAGFHFGVPRVSVDGTEMRAPIEPAYVVEILGQPLVSGRA